MKLTKRTHLFFADMMVLLRTRLFFWCAIFSVVLLVLTAVLPWWRIVPLSSTRPYIPLHYNIYFGVDRLGGWQEIFFIPALGFGLLVLNVILQTIAFQKEKWLAMMLACATVMIELLLLVAMVLIVLLNLSYAA